MTRFILAITGTVAVLIAAGTVNASPGQTERISVTSAGEEANGQSNSPDMSADGRFVTFSSDASNLVPDDTNNSVDIFVHDRQTDETRRVSVASDGAEASRGADVASLVHTVISGDGRFVAFSSFSPDLADPDTNGVTDVFVHDLQTGETTLVSLDETGSQLPDDSFVSDISANGRFVTFFSGGQIYLRDRQNDVTEVIAPGGFSSVSADGRYVAFLSDDETIVLGDTNGKIDIFVRDRQADTAERVSVSNGGDQADGHSGFPSISDDGRFVAFDSDGSNLVPSDDNGTTDVFVHDSESGTVTVASVDMDGGPGGGQIPIISADGRHVAFMSASTASNLVAEDTNGFLDMFVRDLDTESTVRVSVNSFGEEANADSPAITFGPQGISGDGRLVAFESGATNLVADDTNESTDIFVHDRDAPTLQPSPTPSPTPEPTPEPTPTPIPTAPVVELPAGGGSPAPASGTALLVLVGLAVASSGLLVWTVSLRKSDLDH